MHALALVLLAATFTPGYVVEPVERGTRLEDRFTPAQLAILEKLNRADRHHLPRLPHLVIPSAWHDDELAYSPFPPVHPAAGSPAKLLLIDLPAQAFAAYEGGRLVRWGPVSTGGRRSPTPSGAFALTWRARGRYSTVDPEWYMEWYFNFDNVSGLALHTHPLPGYPASHGCVRLLERDAIWLYGWGEPGTPLVIAGQYAFGAPPPWRSLEQLARGVTLGPLLHRP